MNTRPADSRSASSEEVLSRLPVPRSPGRLASMLARHWRFRWFAAGVLLAVVPGVLLPGRTGWALGIALVSVVLAADAYARRQRRWRRYARHYAILETLLQQEDIEDFYVESREEEMLAADAATFDGFGDRPAASHNPIHFLRFLWVEQLLADRESGTGVKVLDLGCKHGMNVPTLRAGDADLVAADLDLEALKAAGTRFPDLPVLCCDAQRVALKSDAFDIVNFSEVLEHLSAPFVALTEIRRCLKPGGMVVLTTENRHAVLSLEWLNPFVVAERGFGLLMPSLLPPPSILWEDTVAGHAYYHADFDHRAMRRLLRDADFDIVFLQSYGYLGDVAEAVGRLLPHSGEGSIARLMYVIDRVLGRLPVLKYFGLHWIVAARRPLEPRGAG